MAKNALDRYTPEEIGAVCTKLATSVASTWKLSRTELQILLGLQNDLDDAADSRGALPDAVVERLGLLLGIDRAACTLFQDRDRATAYLRKANSALDGESAMTIMLRGSIEDLYRIIRFLLARLN